jgi:hypothetical protein
LKIGPGLFQNGRRQAAGLGKKLEQQVFRVDLWIAAVASILLCGNQCLACLCGESIESHFGTS